MLSRLARLLAALALVCAPLAAPAQQLPAPQVKTQAQGDNSTRAANTAYVDAGLAPKAPIANPTFTGGITTPKVTITGTGSTGDLSGVSVTPPGGSADTLANWIASKAPIANPTFTGGITTPKVTITGTGSTGDLSGVSVTPPGGSANTLANWIASKAPIASPTFTGSVTAPVLNLTGASAPTSSADATGSVGDIRRVGDLLYWKTDAGAWRQTRGTEVGESASPWRNQALLTGASGTWTVPVNVSHILVSVQAQGGGSGGVAANTIGTTAGANAGEYSIEVMTVTPGQQIAYTIDNTGGAGGAAGANAGAKGGNATFGPITAEGGLGTPGSSSGNAAVPNFGTYNTARHFFPPDATRQPLVGASFGQIGVAGAGAQGGPGGTPTSGWGAGAIPGNNAAGVNGRGYGSGAAGAASNTNTDVAKAGGNGGPGAIAVRW